MCTSKSIKYVYMDNVDDIDDELKCFLCKEPLQSPVSHTLCHYDFCQDCIEICLEKNRSCPACDQTLNDKIEQENESINLLDIFLFVPISTRIVLNRLDRLLVQCILCKEENIQRIHFKDHEEICIKKIVKCQSVDMKCTWKGPREKLDKHVKICTLQQIRPIIDKFQGKVNKIETRQNQMKISMKKLEKQMAFMLAFINESISINETKTDSEYDDEDKADFSPVSSLHSP